MGVETLIPSSLRSPTRQMISEHALDIAQYSASVEGLETPSHLLFQEILEFLKNMHHLVVDLQELGQPAKSAFVDQPVNEVVVDLA